MNLHFFVLNLFCLFVFFVLSRFIYLFYYYFFFFWGGGGLGRDYVRHGKQFKTLLGNLPCGGLSIPKQLRW